MLTIASSAMVSSGRGQLVGSAIVVIVISWSIEARAVPHRLCLYFDIGDEFWDASPRVADGMEFDEEYGRNLGPTSYPAQRRLARIRDESNGEVIWGWRPLGGWAPFAQDADPACSCGTQQPPPEPGDAGCADFDLDDVNTTLTVEWTRWSVWGDPQDPSAPATGNQIVGYNCDETMTVCDFEFPNLGGISADMSGETTVVIPFLPPNARNVDLPFWAITFAEDRFAALGEQPLENTRVYVGYDEANVLPGVTQADYTFGNQPSVVIDGDSWHGKFVATHEYGHLQTMAAHHSGFGPADLNYCYDPATYPATGNECTPNHLLFSSEWQGAAAIEGFAHWYAASSWHDVDDEECLPSCSIRTSYVSISGPSMATAYEIPRGTPACGGTAEDLCPIGVSNEHDWVSALRVFRLSADTTPDFRTMFTMLEAFYGTGGWVAADPSEAFLEGFNQTMVGHLGAGYDVWLDAAAGAGVDP